MSVEDFIARITTPTNSRADYLLQYLYEVLKLPLNCSLPDCR